jgi:hypothetical protein
MRRSPTPKVVVTTWDIPIAGLVRVSVKSPVQPYSAATLLTLNLPSAINFSIAAMSPDNA